MASANGRGSINDSDSNCPLLLEKECDISQSSAQTNTAKGNGVSTWIMVPKSWRIFWLSVYILLIHGALFTTYFANSKCRPSTPTAAVSFSPALEAIRHEIRRNYPVAEGEDGKFSGPPSPESNLAWDTLVRPAQFSASAEEMRAAGESIEESSVELVEGGYLASTGAYHDLHCLRQIRLYVYKDIFYPNITEAQAEHLQHHIGHCIETLRLSIMCTGDTSMYTFKWHTPQEKPLTKTNSQRSCIVWKDFEDWSRERMVSRKPRLKIWKSSNQG